MTPCSLSAHLRCVCAFVLVCVCVCAFVLVCVCVYVCEREGGSVATCRFKPSVTLLAPSQSDYLSECLVFMTGLVGLIQHQGIPLVPIKVSDVLLLLHRPENIEHWDPKDPMTAFWDISGQVGEAKNMGRGNTLATKLSNFFLIYVILIKKSTKLMYILYINNIASYYISTKCSHSHILYRWPTRLPSSCSVVKPQTPFNCSRGSNRSFIIVPSFYDIMRPRSHLATAVKYFNKCTQC